MNKIDERIERSSKRRSLLKPLHGDNGTLKSAGLHPQDFLVLHQELIEKFSCLQEEVSSALSCTHANVGVKLRQYTELLMARQRMMLEKMVDKANMPGIAETTLSGARHSLAQRDQLYSGEEVLVASKFHIGNPVALDDNVKKQRSSRLQERNSARLPDMHHEDDLETNSHRSAQSQRSETSYLPGMLQEDDPVKWFQLALANDNAPNGMDQAHSGTDNVGPKDRTRHSTAAEDEEEFAIVADKSPNSIEPAAGKRVQILENESSVGGVAVKANNGVKKKVTLQELRRDTVQSVHTEYNRHSRMGPEITEVQTMVYNDDPTNVESLTDSRRNANTSRAKSIKRSIIGRDTVLEKELEEELRINASWIATIGKSKVFDFVCAFILIGNAIFIGVQVENYSSSGKPPLILTILDVVFCAAFLLELMVRMAAEQSLRVYFTKEGDWTWNWFDFCVTSFAVVETALSFILQGSENALATMRVVRVLRVLRMIRVVRIIRVMRFFRSLRILIAAILGTMKSGVWTAMLLIMVVYLFSLLFVQAAVDHLRSLPSDEELTITELAAKDALWTYFGTLPRSIFTLWKAIVGGIDWEVASQALSDLHPLYVAVFIFYIALLYLAVLNVVAGLFLQTAVEQAQQDMHDIAHEVRLQKHWYVSLITEIFTLADKSEDGIVSLSEFEDVMSDPKMMDFLDLLSLEVSDAWTLFKLLDKGDNHGVDADDFLEGCLRLRGPARSLDIAQILSDAKWMREELFDVHNYLKMKLEGSRESRVAEAAVPAVLLR